MTMIAEVRQLHDHLLRRANHLHMFNVARTKPAPEVGRGLFEAGCSRIATYHPMSAHCRETR
jgi:hypothetical protein